jgi:uncharacterized protein (DUF305 family)
LIASSFAFLPAAFAQGPHAGHGAMGGASQGSQAAATSPYVKEVMAKMMSMHDGMMDASKLNGNADHDFLRMMIPHHQGALDMAESYLKFGKDEKVRKLAREIVVAQKKEIAQMEKWLASGVGASK